MNATTRHADRRSTQAARAQVVLTDQQNSTLRVPKQRSLTANTMPRRRSPLQVLAMLAPWLAIWPAFGGGTMLRAQTEPTSQQQRTAIEAVIAVLDKHILDGDIDGYLKRFSPDHRGSLAMMGRHLQRLCRVSGRDRARTSKIIAGPREIGDRMVVRVRHTTTWLIEAEHGDAEHRDAEPRPFELTEDSYLAVRMDEDGGCTPTFAIDMPTGTHCVTGDKFRCPPCNYEIGGVEGFLCVPLRREKTLALESASFYLIGTNVVCDVHVQIERKPTKAKAAVLKLARAFAKIEPSAQIGIPTAWLPAMHKLAPPPGMDAARLVVKLPKDQVNEGGGRTIFHVITFGGLQHVLLVRGSKASLRRHQESVKDLFASYMLLEVDCDEAKLASRPLSHHTGGVITGSTYKNTRYNVTLQGPKNWRAEHRVGGSMFRVHWSGPNGSQMWLIGHAVPAGMHAWTTETADRWLKYQCNKQNLKPDSDHANRSEARWHRDANGSNSRTTVLKQSKPKTPGSPWRRILHVQLHEDLLLVVDGFGTTEADETAVRTAMATLQRK